MTIKFKNKNTTLADVAKYLGVSVSTVSRAVNNSPEISKETKQMVLEAVNKLNYTQNETARNLVTKTNKSVGIIVPDILNPYYSEIIKSIETVLSRNNFSTLLCITNESDIQTDYYLNEMLKKNVSGIILLSLNIKNQSLFERIKKNTVVVGVSTQHKDIDRIEAQSSEGTYKIIKYLIEIGHKKIGFIGYKLFELDALSERLYAYKKALEESGIIYDESLVINGEPLENPGYEDVKQLINSTNKPTAIHCMNEYLAMGAFLALSDMGLSIPKDISLTAHDGLIISKLIRPTLTTVKIPVAAMGEAAAELILQRLNYGKKEEKQTLLFESELVFGESCCAPLK